MLCEPRLLLQAGATATLTDRPHQRTCLHYAAAKGHAEVIELVIQKNQVK
jgi:ankyrin repeat protein